nr:putative polygalacturonase [Quercus suber]
MDGWTNCSTNCWLRFSGVSNLIVNGSGTIDGRGSTWWNQVYNDQALQFNSCNNLQLSGLTHLNSPRNHISLTACNGASLSYLHISAPASSPNTDGIDISSSTNINIHDSNIATGDDCIAINGNSAHINITGINCGPGHGISVGSLGRNGAHETVEYVYVQHCNFTQTQNGARIKTWPGGSGYARYIYFQHIQLQQASNPIIIDQFYCGGGQGCTGKELLTFVLILSISLTCLCRGLVEDTSGGFNVLDYGAIGDGQTDDSQILGTMLAPNSMDGWTNCSANCWLRFSGVSNLIVNGSGTIDGRGSTWWNQVYNDQALQFNYCNNLQLSGLTHLNSPRNHISLTACNGASLSYLHISAPASSPNTDGIDISSSTNINIHDSNIATGDDCIAINGNSAHINITGINCGPGHGISVGSLGRNGAHETVEYVYVQHCNFTQTQNGARIKTWPGGSGYARYIYFQHIQLQQASNPIIIDQFYCDGGQGCTGKELLSIVLVLSIFSTGVGHGLVNEASEGFNETGKDAVGDVTCYGAIGDGETDDSEAFLKAWKALCEVEAASDIPMLIVPKEKIFLLKPVTFKGPCKSDSIQVQVLGTILAPNTTEGWTNCYANTWLGFRNVSNLIVNGSGEINGSGSIWWRNFSVQALRFYNCSNLQHSGLTHLDSPRNHISITFCDNATLSYLNISAPKSSPNTDGVDISSSTNVSIHDSYIGTGDDCIAVNDKTTGINITRIVCGPGHGIRFVEIHIL